MNDATRYLRQLLLPEIGAEGQSRIRVSAARVAGDALRHEVAVRYARRAGFGSVERGPIDTGRFAPDALVAHPAAAEVLAGSRAALSAMREALGIGKRAEPAGAGSGRGA